MKQPCPNNFDLFGDIPSPAAPKKPIDPKACPISYLWNDEELFSRPDRNLTPIEPSSTFNPKKRLFCLGDGRSVDNERTIVTLSVLRKCSPAH